MEQIRLENRCNENFNSRVWNELVDVVVNQFGYDEVKRNRVSESKLLKVIAAIPYLAGCNNPGRTALIHMSTFCIAAESGKQFFLHNFSDNSSLDQRLYCISNFDGGDKQIIRKGMNLLKLVMLSDHKIDSDMDRWNKKYNPINSNVWNYEQITTTLIKENLAIDCYMLDEIMTTEEAVKEPWEM